MSRRFGLYLTIVFIIFSLVISLAIALFDYKKLKEQIHLRHENMIATVEQSVVQSLHTIDQIYSITDQSTGQQMRENTEVMLEMYDDNPNFDSWDFDSLKDQFGMDVFIINEQNIVMYSSFKQDIGLDFEECCGSFAKQVEKRRMGESFHHDGLDIQQATGQIKKFSYMPTPDHKYLFELSLSVEEDEIFKQFNFLKTIHFLENEYQAINSINVYSPNGLVLGYTNPDGKSKKVLDEMRPVFLKAIHQGEVQNAVKQTDEGNVSYRYIPYTTGEEYDYPIRRVVEIVYNEAELEGLLNFYRDEFINQQIFIIVAVVLLSTIIARLMAKPVHLAFHDSLTGLKNRAAFEEEIEKLLKRKNGLVALMMIDIDNFKLVNDYLGHAEGDSVLINTANAIKQVVGKGNVAARIGGDEFVVIYSNINQTEMMQLAAAMIEKMNKEYRILQNDYDIDISISIGIAYATQNEKINSLYDKADQALYLSKENGKNQYMFYSPHE